MKNRANKCVDVVNELMGYALGSKYVQNVFDDESINEVKITNLIFKSAFHFSLIIPNCFDLQIKTMIANLKKAFKSLVDDATWMDSDTKSIAKDKVDAMIEFVGYPPWINNKKSLEDYYNGVCVLT